MSLELQLKEVIEKNLPKQVGETLQKRLEELERVERDYKTKVEVEKNLRKEIDELNERLKSQEELQVWRVQLWDKESKLEERERNLEIELLKVKLEESNKRADTSKELVSLVFKNSTYKYSEFNKDQVLASPVLGSHGNTYYPTTYDLASSKTITKEQE